MIEYRFRIQTPHNPAGTSTGLTDLAFINEVQTIPTIMQPILLPLSGRLESRTWTIGIVDSSGTLTANLADTLGRPDMLNRLGIVETRTDGGAWTLYGVGRIANVALGDDVASYVFTMEDELRLARGSMLFNSSNTTRLYPGGPHTAYGPFEPPAKARGKVVARLSSQLAHVMLISEHPRLTDLGLAAIEADLKPSATTTFTTRGNFNHVRFRVDNADGSSGRNYEILTFRTMPTGSGDLLSRTDRADAFFRTLHQHRDEGEPIRMVVIATSSQLAEDATITDGFLHMFSAPASPATPLHIGGKNYQHPATVVKQCWDGDFSTAGTNMPRYSTASITTVEQEGRPWVRFRVTGPENMERWLEDHIFGPFGMAPFLDSSGALNLRSMWLPNSSSGITFTFTGANLRKPHPTWRNTSRELVTALTFNYTHETQNPNTPLMSLRGNNPFFIPGGPPDLGRSRFTPEGSADLISVTPMSTYVTHDRISNLGVREHSYAFDGIHTFTERDNGLSFIPSPQSAQQALKDTVRRVAREVFDRYGDGPLTGRLYGMSTANNLQPGTYVKLNLATYPALSTATARGGTRYVQLLGKIQEPSGPQFDYIDVGPVQTVTAPKIALSTDTDDPKHTINVLINTLSSGTKWEADIAASSTRPAATSSLWRPISGFNDNSSGTFRIGQLPSGTQYYGRARAARYGIFRSAWANSSSQGSTWKSSVTTQTLTAPTSLTVSTYTPKSVDLTWTVGEAAYPTEICADATTSASLSTANRVAFLDASTVGLFTARGDFSTSSPTLIGVRHRDEFGGVSAFDSTTFTAAGTGPTAPNMLGIYALWGGAT